VNGDGYGDVIQVWDNAGSVSIEGYTFDISAGKFKYTIGGGAKYGPSSQSEFHAGDVNGDGRTDVLHLQANSMGGKSLRIYFSNGSGFNNTSTKVDYPKEPGSFETFWRVGDFNRDGKSDLIQVYQEDSDHPNEVDGYVTYISNGSTLSRNLTAFFPVISTYLSYSYDFLTGDVDGDGDSDLIGRDFYSMNRNGKLSLNLYPNYYQQHGTSEYFTSLNLGGSPALAVLGGNID
jgi:hypothetical protein